MSLGDLAVKARLLPKGCPVVRGAYVCLWGLKIKTRSLHGCPKLMILMAITSMPTPN